MDTHAHKLSGGIEKGLVIDGRGFSEAIKGSNLKDSGAVDFRAVGGEEDVIDCVRGRNYRFERGILTADPMRSPRTFITLKGGISGVVLRDLEMRGQCRYPWQISLGDHTIYNDGGLLKQNGIVMERVRRENGEPVRVLVMDSERPHLMAGDYRVWRMPVLLVWFWMALKG